MSATAAAPASKPPASKESILALLARDPIPVEEVGALLDALSPEARIAAARAIDGRTQRRLFEAAAEGTKRRPLRVEDFVPAEAAPMDTVRHYGKNSLPLFSLFEKRFCRPAAPPPSANGRKTLFGYNHQSMAWITGPGSMVAYEAADGEVWVDYRELPTAVPAGWPAVRANDRGISKLVYANMVDHMRRVSAHVTIGQAWRHGKPEQNYFILCREAR